MTSNSIAGVALAAAMLLALGAERSAAESCRPAPPPVRDLDIPRYYADAAGTVVDPRLKAANEAATAPLVEFVREVVKLADRAVAAHGEARRREAAACAGAWIAAWARGGAYLGSRVTQQGEYQRKWDLGGLALAYVKVRAAVSLKQRKAIEPWLKQVALEAREFFDDRGRKRNNHWYWLGLSLAGVALATDDEKLWAEARGIAMDAARDIRADGALQMELERGAMALHYHAFSVMPLVVLAEIAARRGEDFYAFNDGALHRLVGLTLKGLARPETFETLTGQKQRLTVRSAGAGWLRLYAARFPARVPAGVPALPPGDRRLGGAVAGLMAAVGAAPAR